MSPTSADWISAGGSVLAAWVGVGALLYDRHARLAEDKRTRREVHAWVRFVDDEPELAEGWLLHLSNGTGAPIASWYVELNTGESLGSADLGPLPPGLIRRVIEPLLEHGSRGFPNVHRLVFRQRDGSVVERSGHDHCVQLSAWPSYAARDDVLV